jgi:glycosyltransferase involved in cell wall biosynthesis
MYKTVRILGTHGVPAAYGGFETAAENIALHLVRNGWRVIVYCQIDDGDEIREDVWNGIERVSIPIRTPGWLGTSKFDLLSVRHAVRHRDLCLTFGYNTAVINTLQRVRRIPNIINMDGLEWSRARWGPFKQSILWSNERVGCLVGNHLIADHPEIESHLLSRASADKISMLTYGAATVTEASTDIPESYDLVPGCYFTVVARPIPENSILEIVEAFSRRRRGVRLVVLGDYLPEEDDYHRAVMDAASDEVDFLGPVYEPERVRALRFHSLAYVHGHTVGGTNPSLVEAMGCGNAVIAHDNAYNRWTARDAALYFTTPDDIDTAVTELIGSTAVAKKLGLNARRRHSEEFTWEHVAGQYEQLLERFLPMADRAKRRARRTS